MTRLAFPLLPLLLLLAACDADDPDDRVPAGPGTFRASVSYDDGERTDLSGFAMSSAIPVFFVGSPFDDSLAVVDSGRTAFTIMLVDAQGGSPTASTVRSVSLTCFGSEPLEPGSLSAGRTPPRRLHRLVLDVLHPRPQGSQRRDRAGGRLGYAHCEHRDGRADGWNVLVSRPNR